MPVRGLALLGELWHPVGAVGGVSPPGAVSPRCTWLGSQGRGVGQPRNSGTHLASSMPWEPVLQLVPSHVPPERVLAGAGAQGSCPPASLQPPAGAALGTAGQGRGRRMLEGLSPPLTGPLTPRPILELPSPGSAGSGSISGAPVPALPCVPSWEGSRGPVLLQDSTAQTPVGQGPPAPCPSLGLSKGFIPRPGSGLRLLFPWVCWGLGVQRWERPGRAGLTQARGLQVTWNKSTSNQSLLHSVTGSAQSKE